MSRTDYRAALRIQRNRLLLSSLGWVRTAAIMTLAMTLQSACGGDRGDAIAALEKAKTFRASGDVSAALIELKNALQADPELLEARWILGNLQLDLGDGASANKEFERVAELGQRDDAQAIALMSARLLEGRYKEVLDYLSTIGIEDRPALVISMRGDARFGMREMNAADAAYKRALELDPKSARAMRGLGKVEITRRNLDEGERWISRSLDVDGDDVQTWLLKGRLESLRGDFEAAHAAYARAGELVKDAPSIQLGLVVSLFALERIDEGRELLTQLHRVVPQLPQVNYLRAIDAHFRKDDARTRQALSEVLSVAPTHARALALMGSIHFGEQAFLQAQDMLSRSLASAPRNVQVRKLLASTYMKLGDGERAAEVLEVASEALKTDSQLLGLLGSALLMQGEYRRGSELLQQASALAPDSASIHTQLALSHLDAGELDKAESALKTAVELDPTFARAGLMLIYKHLRESDWAAAIDAAQALTSKRPDDPLPADLLAAAFIGNGDVPSAKRVYTQILKTHPEFVSAALNLAAIAKSEGDIETAIQYYKSILVRDPSQASAATGYAQIALDEAQPDLAIDILSAARAANDQAVLVRLMLAEVFVGLGRFDEAVNVAEEAARMDSQDPRPLLTLSRAHLARPDRARALSAYGEVTRRFPSNVDGLFELGTLELKLRRSRAARDRFEAVLDIDSTHAGARVSMGLVAMVDGELERGLTIAERVIEDEPDLAGAYGLRGDILLRMERPDDALGSYSKAMELKPGSYFLLRKYRALAAAGNESNGRAMLEAHLEGVPEDASIWHAVATLDVKAGDFASAIEGYTKAIELAPNRFLALNNLALLLYEKGDVVVALGYAKRAFELAAKRPDIADTYGWLLVQQGQVEQGMALLEGAARAAPFMMEIQLHLALALEKAGDVKRARRIATVVSRINQDIPEKAKAKELLSRLP
jgi:putative PEP-CTERM system TPR-repeat lipoprotein